MESTLKPPLLQRINFRVIVFAAIFLIPVGWIVYTFVGEVASGGVHDRGSYLEVNLKAMSDFEMDQNNASMDDVPPQWRQLDGKHVLLEGELWAPNSAGANAADLQLCYSVAKCCFSGPPKVQHFVNIHVGKGKKIEFYNNLVRAVGVLHVKIVKDGEKVLSLYSLDVDSIDPVS